jgi:hypothetical protein
MEGYLAKEEDLSALEELAVGAGSRIALLGMRPPSRISVIFHQNPGQIWHRYSDFTFPGSATRTIDSRRSDRTPRFVQEYRTCGCLTNSSCRVARSFDPARSLRSPAIWRLVAAWEQRSQEVHSFKVRFPQDRSLQAGGTKVCPLDLSIPEIRSSKIRLTKDGEAQVCAEKLCAPRLRLPRVSAPEVGLGQIRSPQIGPAEARLAQVDRRELPTVPVCTFEIRSLKICMGKVRSLEIYSREIRRS